MPHKDLNAFLALLEDRDLLQRVEAPVSPALEMTEIVDRISKAGGDAVLFTRPEGYEFPVLMNAVGSDLRMALSLGADSLDDIGAELAAYLDLSRYTSLGGILRFAPKLLRLLCCFPLRRFSPLPAPCQQVVEHQPDLGRLPILKCWPLDGGRFLTLPLVFTKFPGAKSQNMGMYRMQVLSQDSTAMHWHKHKDGSAICEAWRAKGGRMPVAIALGAAPAVTFSATAPLPPGIDELMLAGFLQRRPVTLTKCITCDLWVPADAQFVLEGYVDTEEPPVWEGPFGDHTGYYSLADWYPRFHITCITRRRQPIYPATVVGRPPMEDCFLAKATARIFLPILRLQIPQLADLCLPFEGVFHNLAIVSVKPAFPGAARTVMNAIWGSGQMRYTKLIVAVDEEINPADLGAVLTAVLTHADPERDLVYSEGPLDALDHASHRPLYGMRLGVDATQKPDRPPTLPGTLQVIGVDKQVPWAGRQAGRQALTESDATLILVVDASVNRTRPTEVLWRLCNNIDAGRDLVFQGKRVAVDATAKCPEEGLTRPWPEDISMCPEIKAQVTRRWAEYGLPEEWRAET